MPDNKAILKKSVTADDYADSPRAAVFNFMVPYNAYFAAGGMTPEAPPYWSRDRDRALRATVLHEDFWSAAVSIAITKKAATAWEVDSEIPLRARRIQELLLAVGWTEFMTKHLRDYVTTDNGAFVEVIRATSSPIAKVVGIAHLDGMRCTRTGDPDIPVIYLDRMGREHELKAHQVFALSDLPDPSEFLYGVGYCAASRAWRAIYKLHVMDRYLGEKVSGRRPLAFHFVSSVSPRQLQSAMEAAESDAARQGILSYMGAVVIPLLDASTPPEVSTVPLAELPDRFNRKEEFDIAMYAYADALGLDVQDLQPLTGQPLGTGAQSAVLDEKAKGKGLASWQQSFIHSINEYVCDELSTFMFVERDYRDMERQAQVAKQRADASKVRIDAGITTPAQELQVLVDADELPKEFLPEDVTGDQLSDTEKPEKETAEQAQGQGAEAGEPQEAPAEAETPEGETTPPEPAKAKEIILKHLAGQHNQLSHGVRGDGGLSESDISDMQSWEGERGKYASLAIESIDEGMADTVIIKRDGDGKVKGIATVGESPRYDNTAEVIAFATRERGVGESLFLEIMEKVSDQGIALALVASDDSLGYYDRWSPSRHSGRSYFWTARQVQRVASGSYKEMKEAPPDDDLQAEIEAARDESATLYRQARRKE